VRQTPRASDWEVDVVDQAKLEDGVPVTAGWFVVNARDARWMHDDVRARSEERRVGKEC